MDSPPSKQSRIMESRKTFLGIADKKIATRIINFLSVNDLITLTMVSKDLNEMISNSKYIMADKLKLCIDERWSKEFELDDVTKSSRKYQTLQVKSLLRRQSEVMKAIAHFSRSLTTIITVFDFDMKGFKLPSLKTLEMRIAEGQYYDKGLLSAVNHLESLTLYGSYRYDDPAVIMLCLSNNPGLKKLEFDGQIGYEVFSKMHQIYFDFQLKRFAINILDQQRNIQSFNYNLKHFVISQPTIVDLKLMKIPYIYLTEILTDLDQVERLTYTDGMFGEVMLYGTSRLPVKDSVKELNLVCDPKFKYLMTFLLSRFPNLEKIYYAISNVAIISTVAQHRAIREFKYAFFEDMSDEQEVLKAYHNARAIHNRNHNPEINIKQI